MARTYQQAADRARAMALNDAAKERWSDADLIGFANDAIVVLRRDRPDLFIGQFMALPSSTEVTNGATALPLPDEYFPPVVDYIVARAHGRDSEDAAAELVPAFLSEFRNSL